MEGENTMGQYLNVRETLNSKAKLVPANTKLESVVKNANKDYYVSLYTYNDKHKKILETTGTLSGVTDTVTNRLFFDFDDKENIENAKQDTIITANRLLEKGIDENAIKVYFTGGKGFSIEVAIDEYINPARFGAIVDSVSSDLPTFDTVVREANRIVRIPGTKHQSSGLYKIPLTPEELINLSVDEIKALAVKPRLIEASNVVVSLPAEMKNVKVQEKKLETIKSELSFDISEIDMKSRPKGLDEARWLLSNGFFRTGDRNSAMLCLAATYNYLKFPQEVTRGILDGVAELQSARTGEDKFPEKEIDLVLNQVYSSTWKGGIFTTRDPNNWLHKYATKMKLNIKDDVGPQTLDGIHESFKYYVDNIEKNTIKTGIPELDKALPITIGSNIGIVAAAGAGKTALALKILKYNSEQGIPTVFCSLDMVKNRLFEKVLYNVTGLSREDLYAAFKAGKGQELTDMVRKHYGNVWFYDRSSATIADIRQYILDVEQKTGQKIKMVMLDYFERINTGVSDDTASSKALANEIQDMVNDHDIAAITLCQPNKFSLGGGPDTEIKSYTAIKGSSFLYQSFRGILSLSRPFYTPSTKDLDKFCIVNILKNDLGEQNRLIFGWKGKTGDIYTLEDAERAEFDDLMKQKDMMKDSKSSGWE